MQDFTGLQPVSCCLMYRPPGATPQEFHYDITSAAGVPKNAVIILWPIFLENSATGGRKLELALYEDDPDPPNKGRALDPRAPFS